MAKDNELQHLPSWCLRGLTESIVELFFNSEIDDFQFIRKYVWL